MAAESELDGTDGGNWAHIPGQAFSVPTSSQAGGFTGHGGYGQPCRFAPLGVFTTKCDRGLQPVYGRGQLPASYGSSNGRPIPSSTCTCLSPYLGASPAAGEDPNEDPSDVAIPYASTGPKLGVAIPYASTGPKLGVAIPYASEGPKLGFG